MDENANVNFENMQIPVAEACISGATAKDLQETGDEMWKTRNALSAVMEDMTLEECQKVVEVVGEWKKTFRTPAA
jgi:hypothetical protein